MHQKHQKPFLKPLPEGYKVKNIGYRDLLYKGDTVIAEINLFRPPNFRNENFIMSIYESDDWEVLDAFFGNYFREIRARKQGGK